MIYRRINSLVFHTKALLNYLVARCVVFFIPIRRNKFFCISMTGNSYGDSIKCLSDYVVKQNVNAEIVWAFTSNYFKIVNCEHKKVVFYSYLYYYHILTSRFIISNVSLDKKMLIKRRGQICVQTWHGTALKRIGTDMYPNNVSSFKRLLGGGNITKYNARLTDLLISGSRFMTEIYHTKCLYPLDIIHEIGTPRNDVFFHDTSSIKQRVYAHYGIDNKKKVLLYAPTFRKGESLDYYDVDLERIKTLLEKKEECEYIVMVRLHPNLIKKEKMFVAMFPQSTINVSSYPDMIDLLCSADVLVTDYSSCMFDYMYSYKPIILYVPDRSTYDRGFYLDIDKLPFVVINSNKEIENKVSSFNNELYIEKINEFLLNIGSKESGNATECLYDLLTSY